MASVANVTSVQASQLFTCPKSLDCTNKNVVVTAISQGSIYIDGEYTGQKTPNAFSLTPGEHIVSVGLDKERLYLKKTVNIIDNSRRLARCHNAHNTREINDRQIRYIGCFNFDDDRVLRERISTD